MLVIIKKYKFYIKKTDFIGFCHGTGAVATERMYLRSLQDVARSIVRVKGVRR